MKISIIYYSQSGWTESAAKKIADGAAKVPDTEVRLFNLKNEDAPDKDFLSESSAVIFGSPTYVANICWQMKKWFDTSLDIRLGGKLGAVFATEASPNGGGAELAIMTMVSQLLVRGMLVYSSGNECGKPTIHIGPAICHNRADEMAELCEIFGNRIACKAHSLFDRQKKLY